MDEHLALLERYVEDTGNGAVSCGLGYYTGMQWEASVGCRSTAQMHVITDDCACESARGDTPGEALRALVAALALVEGRALPGEAT